MLVHIYLAVVLESMRAMYADFGGELPVFTRVVLSPHWRMGVPAVGAFALLFLVQRRSRRLISYLLLAVALSFTVTATWYFAHAPVRDLAGTIRAHD